MFQYCITVPVLQYSFLLIRLIHHIISNNNIHKNTYYNDLLLTLPYPCALANNFVCIWFALQGSSDSEGTRERCWLRLSRIQQDLEVSLGSLVPPSRFQPWSLITCAEVKQRIRPVQAAATRAWSFASKIWAQCGSRFVGFPSNVFRECLEMAWNQSLLPLIGWELDNIGQFGSFCWKGGSWCLNQLAAGDFNKYQWRGDPLDEDPWSHFMSFLHVPFFFGTHPQICWVAHPPFWVSDGSRRAEQEWEESLQAVWGPLELCHFFGWRWPCEWLNHCWLMILLQLPNRSFWSLDVSMLVKNKVKTGIKSNIFSERS